MTDILLPGPGPIRLFYLILKNFTVHKLGWFAWAAVGIGALFLFVKLLPPGVPEGDMEVYEFGKIPVVADGRVKPLDTLARNSLMIISSRQEYTDATDTTQPAIVWLLELLSSRLRNDPRDQKEPVFVCEDAQVRNSLGLPARANARYSVLDLEPKAEEFFEQARRANHVEASKRTPFDRSILALAEQVRLYNSLGSSAWNQKVFRIDNDQVLANLGLAARSGRRYSIAEFAPHFSEFGEEANRLTKKPDKERDVYEEKTVQLASHIRLYDELSQLGNLRAAPPAKAGGEWMQLGEEAARECSRRWLAMLGAFAKNDKDGFNRSLSAYELWLERQPTREADRAGFETFFNNFEPFYWCAIFYAVVFLLACFSWVGYREPLGQAAFGLAVLTLLVHSLAILGRMYMQGRPPVTNLYSSAVFIGWGCVVIGLALEMLFHNSIGTLVAGVMGGLTMIVAIHLAEGDTMEMMRAVLDTNFWLATHVTCVTFGYTATFVAALLGSIYILGGVFTRELGRAGDAFGDKVLAIGQTTGRTLGMMLYAIVCFAMFFSFVGTVLGGIWADQSWGRFWGWDPKENGALLIVLINAIILHARWGGLVKQRGMAVLTVAGAMVTVWSWFGTNQLGVGLHAYGFNNTLVMVCNGVWVFCLSVVGVGLVPLRYWRSFAPGQAGGAAALSSIERPKPRPRPV